MQTIEMPAYHERPDLARAVVSVLNTGALVAIPTDTTWAIVADAMQPAAVSRLAQLRQRMSDDGTSANNKERTLSLMCDDLTTVGTYAIMDQPQFRLLRRLLPGPYTVILPASRQVPKLLQSKRRTVGVRMPDHLVAQSILTAAGRPLVAATARRAVGGPYASSTEIVADLGRDLGALVESDPIYPESSTILDCTDVVPRVLRAGRGTVDPAWDVPSDHPSP